MDKEYIVTDADVRDKYLYMGKQLQNYAIALQGEDSWIMLTQRPETPPPLKGDKLFGHIEDKRSQGGDVYRKFKKVNPDYTAPQSGQDVKESSKLDYMVKMLEELTGRPKQQEVTPGDDPFEGMF